MPVPVAAGLSWVDVPSSAITNAMSSTVARGVGVVAVTGPTEGPVATGEDGAHTSRLEEVLIGLSSTDFAHITLRETYVVPRVDESNSSFSSIPFVRFTVEN